MGPRGRRFKGKQGRGKPSRKGKAPKPKPRQRKTYSLYANSGKSEEGRKRKPSHFVKNDDKRRKLEERRPESPKESESESELEEHIKQLRESFTPRSDRKSEAIDSSDDDTEEEEEKIEASAKADGSEGESDDGSELGEGDSSSDETSIPGDGNEKEAEVIEATDENEEDDVGKEEMDVDLQSEAQDPFAGHLFYDLSESLLATLQKTPQTFDAVVENWRSLGRLVVEIPRPHEEAPATSEAPKTCLEKQRPSAAPGKAPRFVALDVDALKDLCVKPQIIGNLVASGRTTFTNFQSELFALVNNYQDVYFPGRTFENADEVRFVYCLHVVNHVLKTRTKILHHNARLSTRKDDVPEEFRDQGLVRPKVLIVAPFRDSAYKIVKTIIDILIPEDKGNVINKNRFVDDYTGGELHMPKKNPKPEDYEKTFVGNVNDDFKIGITVTKKSLKLYADFYSSDIIIASPLGLRFTIGAEGEPERDHDFLASIELLVLDQTEIFAMQNWDHLLHALSHLHLQPKEPHGTDFSRVRTWSLNGWAKYYRQTLIFSSVALPEIASVFNKRCFNYAGRIRASDAPESGSIEQVFVQLPHVFRRFEAESPARAIDQRFDFFVEKVLPSQRDPLMKQTMVYVSSYFDYVRLRNRFKRDDTSFVQVCEYSKDGKVARARDMFYHGDAHFLLYTERFHFYRRMRVKGVRHLVFYQPPSFPHFYSELCNLMREVNMNRKVGSASNMTVTVVYSKYDAQRLAAIVGAEKAAKMLSSERNVHMMMTGAE